MDHMTFTWNVSPELIHLGPVVFRWYGVLFASSFAIGFNLVKRMFIREKRPLIYVDYLVFYMMVGTIIGARLGHTLFYEPQVYLADPIRILYIWEGGLAESWRGRGDFCRAYRLLYEASRFQIPLGQRSSLHRRRVSWIHDPSRQFLQLRNSGEADERELGSDFFTRGHGPASPGSIVRGHFLSFDFLFPEPDLLEDPMVQSCGLYLRLVSHLGVRRSFRSRVF